MPDSIRDLSGHEMHFVSRQIHTHAAVQSNCIATEPKYTAAFSIVRPKLECFSIFLNKLEKWLSEEAEDKEVIHRRGFC